MALIDPRTRPKEKTALKWFNIVEITNIHDKSLKGFKHLNAQHNKLKEYLEKFQGLLVKVSITYLIEVPKSGESVALHSHTKKLTITNETEINTFFKNMPKTLCYTKFIARSSRHKGWFFKV